MLKFLVDNAATILISALLLGVVVFIIRNMRKKANRGQCVGCSGCSGDCACKSEPPH